MKSPIIYDKVVEVRIGVKKTNVFSRDWGIDMLIQWSVISV